MGSAIEGTGLFARDSIFQNRSHFSRARSAPKPNTITYWFRSLTLQSNADAADHSSTIEGLVEDCRARARMVSSVKAVMKMNGGTPLSAGP
jgi:hypothetical protein